MRSAALVALFVATATWPAVLGSVRAQQFGGAEQSENPDALITIEGSCSELIVSGDDLSDRCSEVVLNTVYRDGRAGFMFVARDLAVATFSGDESPPMASEATVQLDRVILATLIDRKPRPVTLPATGTCIYSNVGGEQIRINCSAATDRGPFRASFVSNGKPPTMTRS